MDSYEKKYKEALEIAKDCLKDGIITNIAISYIETIFPELKESEDEKIRNVLVDYFKRYKEQEECGIKTFYGIPADNIIAWLEKQGTRPRYNIGDIICDKSCTTLNKEAQPNMEIVDIQNGMYICDKGSFPVSQQDEYVLVSKKIDSKLNDNSVSNELRTASIKHAEKEILNPTFPDNKEFELAYTFEEGAKWNAAQKPAWSEEEEETLDEIINFLENGTVKLQHDLSLYASWLKSLKGRVGCEVNYTTTKKWSDEDENILQWIISDIVRLNKDSKKSNIISNKEINWLKSLKDRVKTQQEWTMQDEEELQIALDTLAKAGQHSSAKWLKNVCLVPQNKWKPSEEQMKELNYAVNAMASSRFVRENACCYNVLKSLHEQLMKLK